MLNLYPKELLPKYSYKFIFTESLPQKSHLIRISHKEIDILDENGEVRVDALIKKGFDKDIYGYSTNLFNKFLPSQHIKFWPSLDKNKDYKWKPGKKILAARDIRFDILKNKIPIYLKLDKLHKRDFKYEKKNSDKELENYTGSSRIVHTPMDYNFWHFELKIYDKNGDEINREPDPNWKKNAAKSFIKFTLKNSASTKCPEAYHLKKSIYKHNIFMCMKLYIHDIIKNNFLFRLF